MTDTPRAKAIWDEIELANHPETDGPHFAQFMQTARNGIEALEREALRLAGQWKSLKTSCDSWVERANTLEAQLAQVTAERDALKDRLNGQNGMRNEEWFI